MCEFISFFHNPATGAIKVHDLNSHGNTEEALKLDHHWREGHYLPDGTVEARVLTTDKKTAEKCSIRIKQSFPRFVDFLTYALTETNQMDVFNDFMDLRVLTSAEGLKLPKEINGSLYLDGLTSAEGLKLPKKINGALSLNGLKSAEGLKLPKEMNGCLYLDGLTSAEGLKLPEKINGALSLNSLKSLGGVKLPKSVGKIYCGK